MFTTLQRSWKCWYLNPGLSIPEPTSSELNGSQVPGGDSGLSSHVQWVALHLHLWIFLEPQSWPSRLITLVSPLPHIWDSGLEDIACQTSYASQIGALHLLSNVGQRRLQTRGSKKKKMFWQCPGDGVGRAGSAEMLSTWLLRSK